MISVKPTKGNLSGMELIRTLCVTVNQRRLRLKGTPLLALIHLWCLCRAVRPQQLKSFFFVCLFFIRTENIKNLLNSPLGPQQGGGSTLLHSNGKIMETSVCMFKCNTKI